MFVQEDRRRFVSQDTGHLYIAKVEPWDVGSYTCVVTSVVTGGRVLGPPTPLVLRADGRGDSPEGRAGFWRPGYSLGHGSEPAWACCPLGPTQSRAHSRARGQVRTRVATAGLSLVSP